jgi:hypothetical protein
MAMEARGTEGVRSTEGRVDKELVYISFHATTFLMHEGGGGQS